MRYLLDVNVLVALALPSHTSHKAAHSWFRREPNRLWATCPLTQGGFLRVASRLLGGSRHDLQKAIEGLEEDCRNPAHDFWPGDVDLLDLSNFQRAHLLGSNQVADMQLLMLAQRHRGLLVTFDTGVQELAAGTRYAGSLEVI